MLKDTVIAALEAHFGTGVTLIPSATEFATFEAKHPGVGNVVIEDDGTELTVSVGNIHDGHLGVMKSIYLMKNVKRLSLGTLWSF